MAFARARRIGRPATTPGRMAGTRRRRPPAWLDPQGKGPVRVSAPAPVRALQRIEIVRDLGITLAGPHVRSSRIATLARFASTVRMSAVARLPDARRIATLVAFVHCLEASAQDDALDVLDRLLRELFTRAEKEDRKVQAAHAHGSGSGRLDAGAGVARCDWFQICRTARVRAGASGLMRTSDAMRSPALSASSPAWYAALP